MTLAVDLVNGTDFTITFAGDTTNDDIGSIGFDELNEPGFLVKSVSMNLDATGAWNEAKEFDFSVPGAVSTDSGAFDLGDDAPRLRGPRLRRLPQGA